MAAEDSTEEAMDTHQEEGCGFFSKFIVSAKVGFFPRVNPGFIH